ncbi:VOC family protein [Streptomyces sp. NPDC091292]|uniref:VOC family protein n=1 Tax=Streptomyces sp. NPDC091292 TaxID=3365991 RepID=UPI0038225AAE
MTIRRAVPDIHTKSPTESSAFYTLLGFEEVMNLGWVTTMASPSNPTAQITLITEEQTAPVVPDISVEVEDVDAVHAAVRASGAEIVRDLRDEPWGVRRFFVRDPNGKIINVVSHQQGSPD